MPQTTAHYFLIIFILIFLALAAFLAWGFLTPIVLGIILAALGGGWYVKIIGVLRSPNLSALVTLFLLVAIIVIPATLLLTLLAREAITLARHIERTDVLRAIDITTARLSITPFIGELVDKELFPALKAAGEILSRRLTDLFGGAARAVLGFFVMAVTAFYFLRDGKKIGDAIMALSPLKTSDELNLFHTFKEVLRAVFLGNLASALAQGALGGLGFWVFGLPNPILWGALMAFLALIPLLGPYLIFVPAAIYLFTAGTLAPAILFTLYNVLLVSTVDNFIKPKLISGRVNVHPLLILISILGGLKAFGILGILYGPLIVSMLLVLLNIYLRSTKNESLLAS